MRSIVSRLTMGAPPPDRWLVLGLVTVLAGCAGTSPETTSPEKRDAGARDQGPPREKGEPPAEIGAGKAPVCSVAGATDLGTVEATSPAVAFAAGRFAVAWTEQHTGLHVAVVDDRGNQAGARVLVTGPHPVEPAVTALPAGGFFVAWQEPGAVRGIRVGADAAPAGSAFTVGTTPGGAPRPSTASEAAGTVITWADTAGATVGELDETGIARTVSVPGAADPSLAASAEALVFTSGDKLGFARLALPLHSVGPAVFGDLPGKIRAPRASAAGRGSFFVTWEDDAAGDGNEAVDLTLVSPDGKLAGEVVVPGEAGSANYPDVATVGGYAAVVYYQFRDGPPAIYLSLRGPDLRPAGEDLRISEKGARFPRVAAGAPGEGELGVVYARREAPARLSRVTCR